MTDPVASDPTLSRLSRRELGRLMTAVENHTPEAASTIARLQENSWPGLTIGITGPPGCGKSTLAGAMTREWRRRDKAVGVLAIDPSSRRTGGALLGDRIRMMDLATDEKVLIRSLASRGHGGGVNPAVYDLARLLRAAGFDRVLIETVGVGQDEVEIAGHADVTLVVQSPGLGDDIQALKKGLLEVADLFVVNKADQPGAENLVRDLEAWSVTGDTKVLQTEAASGRGIVELLDGLEEISGELIKRKASSPSRTGEIRARAMELLGQRLDQKLRDQPVPPGDTWTAAERLVNDLLKPHE